MIPSEVFKKRETFSKTVSRSWRETVRKETGLPGQGLWPLKLVSRKFIAGQVNLFFDAWNNLTSDPYVLDIILCWVKLDFIKPPPFPNSHILTHFPTALELAINQELTILLQKKVICPTTLSPTSYVSPIFTTEKKDGSHRLFLNLKHFNECIRCVHFEMENLQDVFALINPGVWMASLDLCDAYYTIPVARDHQHYLTFSWKGVALLHCQGLSMGHYFIVGWSITKIILFEYIEDALADVKWWSLNVEVASKFIHPSPVALTLYADASLEGWGGTNSF